MTAVLWFGRVEKCRQRATSKAVEVEVAAIVDGLRCLHNSPNPSFYQASHFRTSAVHEASVSCQPLRTACAIFFQLAFDNPANPGHPAAMAPAP
jgi:hypothetical protein